MIAGLHEVVLYFELDMNEGSGVCGAHGLRLVGRIIEFVIAWYIFSRVEIYSIRFFSPRFGESVMQFGVSLYALARPQTKMAFEFVGHGAFSQIDQVTRM